ncbi:MAG: S9 family peptidase [Ignavibacteriaceae bacterium]|nr:S9 family peptidase [Ignavibacteriaceae bacterium]
MKIPILILAVIIFMSTSYSQTKLLQPENLFDIKSVTQVALSPQGNYAAYILSVPRKLADGAGGGTTELYLYNLRNSENTLLYKGDAGIGNINWVPGSMELTYTSNLGGGVQVHKIDLKGKLLETLTKTEGGVIKYQHSPDGKGIFYTKRDVRFTEIAQRKKKGFNIEIYEEEYPNLSLCYYDFQNKKETTLTKEVSVFDFTISPDGKGVLCQIADKNLIDDEYMFKRVFYLDLTSGSLTKVVENPGKLSVTAWSPDSKNFAIIAAQNINDNYSGSLFTAAYNNTLPFTGLPYHTKGFIGSVNDVVWLNENTLLYLSDEGVNTTLRSLNLSTGESTIVLEGGKIAIDNISYAAGKVLMSAHTAQFPPELFIYDLNSKELKILTNHNDWLKDYRLGKQEKITYKAKDGLEIEGILIYPVDYREGEKYPLINSIHGGPEACEKNGWLTRYGKWGQFAATRGYFVFYPNYRASSGRGVEFSHYGFGDLVGGEFEDVVDGVDFLINSGKVDPNRVGMGGGSYGGYFSAWAATKYTDRFAASVVFVGVSNQISKSNTTDIPWEDYYVHWGLFPYQNFEKFLERSPVAYSHLSKTPTLILHGKDDPRVPVGQGIELYRTLKLHGKAPVRLVLYPGEGHGNRLNTNQYDYLIRTLDWFDYYLKGNNDKSTMPAMYPVYNSVSFE